jgi:formylglycine-generating enzyme required for sulfatase activity
VGHSQLITNSIGMKLVLISKGTFTMGSPIHEEMRYGDEKQHQVTISNDYYLGVKQVTQLQYERVIGTTPSHFQKEVVRESYSTTHPVENISWDDAVMFCRLLSNLPTERKAGRIYRLPTEAEWEYACRAGSQTAYSFGESSKLLSDYAWFEGNSDGQTHPVGEKKPNAWGLYDMHGNVFEWCSDWYGHYPTGAVNDPVGPEDGSGHVLRGGGCLFVAAYCRSAYRSWLKSSFGNRHLGLRVALSPAETPRSAEP